MSTDGVNVGRRRLLIGLTGAVGAVGVAGVAVPFVKSLDTQCQSQGSWGPGHRRHWSA
jgi:ubiquinol-cytochrome c reductase iron-sulfur subunit